MTNYVKKRARQNGRQKCKPSERYRAELDEKFRKSGEIISGMIERGELPPVSYCMKPVTQEEFAKDYPNEKERP